jgi:hypothetical protein
VPPRHLEPVAGPTASGGGATARHLQERSATALTAAAVTAVGLVAVLLAVLVLPATQASAAPPPVIRGSDIEAFAPFQGQTACEAIARPGVTAFRDLVLATYPHTRNAGIVRTCSIRGASEHKEGRAWDWKVDAAKPDEAAAVDDLLAWMMAEDEHGNSAAMARRLGVMYVIWNSQIWKSYQVNKGWQPYRGANAHVDHVHISFSWAGALQRTSYWTGQVSPTVQSPIVVATPTPAASPPPDALLGDPLLTTPGSPAVPVSPSASSSPSPTQTATAPAVVKRTTARPAATRPATPRPAATRSATTKPSVRSVTRKTTRKTTRRTTRRTARKVAPKVVPQAAQVAPGHAHGRSPGHEGQHDRRSAPTAP